MEHKNGLGTKKRGQDCTGWWETDMEGENTGMVKIKATT